MPEISILKIRYNRGDTMKGTKKGETYSELYPELVEKAVRKLMAENKSDESAM